MHGRQERIPLLQRLIRNECTHIPRDFRGSPQNELREVFVFFRQSQPMLTKGQALEKALCWMRERWPEVEFKFDRAFFEKPIVPSACFTRMPLQRGEEPNGRRDLRDRH